MAKIRETYVDPDVGPAPDPLVIERPRRAGGRGFRWGLLLGGALIAATLIAVAYSQGSFGQAFAITQAALTSNELSDTATN